MFDVTAVLSRVYFGRGFDGAFQRVSRDTVGFTLKKLECSKQAFKCLNIRAWNNEIGSRFYFVGFQKST